MVQHKDMSLASQSRAVCNIRGMIYYRCASYTHSGISIAHVLQHHGDTPTLGSQLQSNIS